MTWVIAIILLLYFIAEGATEGWFWASTQRRLDNHIIRGRDKGNGRFDYHFWRFLETIFIYVCSILLLGFWNGTGMFLIGLFVYERVVCRVVNDNWFKEEGWKYYIAGYTFSRYRRQDWTALIVGTLMVIL